MSDSDENAALTISLISLIAGAVFFGFVLWLAFRVIWALERIADAVGKVGQ